MGLALEGRVALVTGGAGGIGAAITKSFLAQGATVAVVDVNEAPIDAMLAHAQGGAKVKGWLTDVRDTAAVEATCDEIAAAFGPVSILVNNVGGTGKAHCTGIEDLTDEAWQEVVTLNLGSIIRFTRKLVPGMKQQGWGRVINVGSSMMHGFFGNAGTAQAVLPYVMVKSAYTGLTKQLAYDLGRYGITVNALIPGLTLASPDATIAKRFAELPQEVRDALNSRIPVGRMANGDDMANTACFYASPASDYITAQSIWVTGGSGTG
jgi:2-hydroxycyclohexanecarboxyl-CoA dehydrogenase